MSAFSTIKTNIKNEVRYDTASSELSDASYWNRWVNQCYDEILNGLQDKNPNWFIKKYATPYTFTTSTQFQDLPTDYIKFVKLVETNAIAGDDYPDVPKGNIETGRPGYVLTYKQASATSSVNQIGMVGITDYPKQYDLWYQMRPAQLSADTDVPAFNERYHEILEYGGIWKYWIYREDEKQGLWKAMYEEGKRELYATVPDDNSFNGNYQVNNLTDGWE